MTIEKLMESRKHFLILDAMRGIAALAVLLFHIGQDSGSHIVPDGYLAVDFFFVLSGFVVTLAYEGNMSRGLRANEFIIMRIKRLYPTIAIGMIIGLIPLALNINPYAQFGLWVIPQFLLLPMMTGVLLYPINGPIWSIFYELCANLLHVTIFKKLSIRLLAVIIVLSGIGLFSVAFMRPAKGVEWGFGPGLGFLFGFARLTFSYVAGILICRLYKGGYLKAPMLHPLIAPGILVAVLLTPNVLPAPLKSIIALTVIFPMIIIIGINSQLRWMGLARYLGGISFPLYAVHAPLLYVLGGLTHPGIIGWGLIATAIIIVATIVDHLFDTPHQIRLQRAKLVKRGSPAEV
jgi:peptidoglycan/LPS O-acetylase OafA/YrhL